MSTVINIRGPAGSGKTTLAKTYMSRYDPQPLIEKEGATKPVGHYLDNGVVVIGFYPETSKTGGCDTISKVAEIERLVERAVELGANVLYEGYMYSTIWHNIQELRQRLEAKGNNLKLIYMDTPPELSIARIKMRNGGKPFKEENCYAKYKIMQRQIQKARDEAFDFHLVRPEDDGVALIESLLAAEISVPVS